MKTEIKNLDEFEPFKDLINQMKKLIDDEYHETWEENKYLKDKYEILHRKSLDAYLQHKVQKNKGELDIGEQIVRETSKSYYALEKKLDDLKWAKEILSSFDQWEKLKIVYEYLNKKEK